jgi:hypothetical protein
MQRVHAAKVHADEQREWTRISQRARPFRRPQRRWATHLAVAPRWRDSFCLIVRLEAASKSLMKWWAHQGSNLGPAD